MEFVDNIQKTILWRRRCSLPREYKRVSGIETYKYLEETFGIKIKEIQTVVYNELGKIISNTIEDLQDESKLK